MTKKSKNKSKASPKDVFLHLLSIGTLYFSAGAFLTLVFALINIAVPDQINQYYDPTSSLQWSISLLIVLFPVYLWTLKTLHAQIRETKEAVEYRIRKWLIYFTMFAAAAFILGDLVRVVNEFLGGELTAQFILKALAVLVVAAIIFGYYKQEAKGDIEEITDWSRKLLWVTSVLVAGAVIAGFVVVGSPGERRDIRADSERVQDLSTIQSQIVSYWQAKDTIPESLDEVVALSGTDVLVDPRTDEPYEYTKLGELSFELCAIFETKPGSFKRPDYPHPLAPHRGGEGISNDWTHEAGRKCFERTIDPDFYNTERNQASELPE